MGKQTVPNAIDYIPVIMSYTDEGFTLDNIDEFIKSVQLFKVQAAEHYAGKTIKIYFLPEEQVNMLNAMGTQQTV